MSTALKQLFENHFISSAFLSRTIFFFGRPNAKPESNLPVSLRCKVFLIARIRSASIHSELYPYNGYNCINYYALFRFVQFILYKFRQKNSLSDNKRKLYHSNHCIYWGCGILHTPHQQMSYSCFFIIQYLFLLLQVGPLLEQVLPAHVMHQNHEAVPGSA